MCYVSSLWKKLVFYVRTLLVSVQRKYKFLAVSVQEILGQENPKFLAMHMRAKAFGFSSRTFWRCLYKPAASRSLARSSQ